jgi:hypothetical protein
MNVGMDPNFSAALRAELVRRADAHAQPSWRRRRSIVAVVTGTLLIGGGAALASSLWAGQPGSEIVRPLGESFTLLGAGSKTIDLSRHPRGATRVIVDLTCLTPGSFSIGSEASLTCGPSDILHLRGRATSTIEFTGATKLRITADTDARWRLVAVYASAQRTNWAVNDRGDTYGVPNEQGTPTLVPVVATNGISGYAYAEELFDPSPQPSSPSEALAMQKGEGTRTVPVYESDGVTVVGSFIVQ